MWNFSVVKCGENCPAMRLLLSHLEVDLKNQLYFPTGKSSITQVNFT